MSILDSIGRKGSNASAFPYHYVVYHYDVKTCTQLMAYFGFWSLLCNAFVVPVAIKNLGELRALQCGFLLTFLGFTLNFAVYFAGAPCPDELPRGTCSHPFNYWKFFLVPIASCGYMSSPTQNGIVIRAVEKHEQGKLQGANATAEYIAKVVAGVIFGALFEPLQDLGLPSGFQLVLGLCVAPGLFCSAIIHRRYPELFVVSEPQLPSMPAGS